MRPTATSPGLRGALATTLLLAATTGPTTWAPAQGPELLVDINQTSRRFVRSSSPTGQLAGHDVTWNRARFATVGSHMFFRARSTTAGEELFFCTTAPDSAQLVADIFVGANGSEPTNFLPAGDRLYFVATDGTNGYQLWQARVANGRASATRLTNFAGTGTAAAFGPLIRFRGAVYFTLLVSQTGRYHIHHFDPVGNTVSVLTPAMTAHWIDPVDMGTHVIFEGKDTRGSEPWWMDDKDRAGNLVDYPSGDGFCRFPIVRNGQVYFATNAGSWKLHRWDNTNGLRTLATLPDEWKWPVLVGSRIVFAANDAAGIDRPYSIDAAAANPALQALPNECDFNNQAAFRNPVVMNGKCYYYGFSGKQALRGNYLFESDGVTVRAVPGSMHSFSQTFGISWEWPLVMQGSKPYIVFQFRQGSIGADLFGFDGTTFARIAHLHVRITADSAPRYLTQLGDTVLFQATDGLHGVELFSSDGTPTGTALHTNIAKESRTDGSFPRNFARLGRKVFFSANDGVHGFELWSSDGVQPTLGPGTKMVKDINPGAASSNPKSATGCEAMRCILFEADDGSGGTKLYVYDDEKESVNLLNGTWRLQNTDRDWMYASKHGEYLVLPAWNSTTGKEPRVYNRSTNDLDLLADTNPGAADGEFDSPSELDGRLYWGSGGNVWSTGGTKATTKKEPLPNTLKYKGDMIPLSGRIVFKGEDGQGRAGAYSYEPRTGKVEKIRGQIQPFDNVFLSPFIAANKAWFLATLGGNDVLFSTDGTAANTKQVGSTGFFGFARFFNNATGRMQRTVDLGASGASIVFGNTATGTGIYKVDAAATFSRVGQTTLGGNPTEAIPLGGSRAAFIADTQNNGTEVLVTDGTKTDMISEPLGTGTLSGSNREGGLWAMDGRLIFTGNDPFGPGTELFLWRAGALATSYGIPAEDLLRLASTDPVLGQALRLTVTGGGNATAGLLFFAPPEVRPLVFLQQQIYIQLSFFAVLATTLANGAGQWTIPVPNDPNLIGLGIDGQAVVSPSNNPLGGALTNAVNLHAGR